MLLLKATEHAYNCCYCSNHSSVFSLFFVIWVGYILVLFLFSDLLLEVKSIYILICRSFLNSIHWPKFEVWRGSQLFEDSCVIMDGVTGGDVLQLEHRSAQCMCWWLLVWQTWRSQMLCTTLLVVSWEPGNPQCMVCKFLSAVPLACWKQVCLQPSHNRLDCELSRCTVRQIYILEQLVLMERMCSCVVCHSFICQELMIASLTMLLNSWLLSAGLRMTHGRNKKCNLWQVI